MPHLAGLHHAGELRPQLVVGGRDVVVVDSLESIVSNQQQQRVTIHVYTSAAVVYQNCSEPELISMEGSRACTHPNNM